MRHTEALTVTRLDGPAAERAEADFTLVYADAFAEPPYRETEHDVAATFQRFRSHTRKRTFRAALARTPDGTPIGMAYGSLLGAQTGWWDSPDPLASDDIRREAGHRTFGLMELAVRLPWRGLGLACRLHETLLDGVEAGRVRLHVHPASEAAQAAYRSWGYRKVGEAHPWTGADLHDVMVLNLPQPPA
ncbi:acetyltransferase [Streptomyces noursei ATCC 11455]|uniref:GNAT family N-acetyltransferase n=1 Tax=Streptomyces noursei TaxID=1971 RepID=UPI00081CE051|nr:acetyltransferase [Streptomyces noursei ATCC 11455]